jgi:putative ABC transport system permease protein
MHHDLRFALRMMRHNPGFTIAAVISLALGIGVNSAVFSFADALLLRPLPVPRPSEVVTLSSTVPDMPLGSFGSASYPDYLDFRDRSKSFRGLTAFAMTQVGLAEKPEDLPQLRLALVVSGDFFRVLGVAPGIGRDFSPDEDRVAGRDAVLLLGYDTWHQRFGEDPKILGRIIRVNDIEFRIIGVAPRDFTGVDPFVRPDLYIPATMLPRVAGSRAHLLDDRDNRYFTLKGRLLPGVSIAQAQAELTDIAGALEKTWPDTNRNHGVRIRTELQVRVEQSPPQAGLAAMLLGIAGLVLLIACANVANLLLSRARTRSLEMAVRLAIGAGRRRLLRQLLTESLVLALAAGALGLLLADSGADYFSSIRFRTDLPISLSARLDQRVLWFSLAASVLSALLFGLAPAIRSCRTDLIGPLKSSESDRSRGRTLGKNALVICQVGLSLMLLVAASTFFRGFRHALLESPGFRTDHLLMMSFDPGLVRYSPKQTGQFYETLVDRARQVPGVRSAALSATVPFGTSLASRPIVAEGYTYPRAKSSDSVFYSTVSEQYFDAMGTAILRGRAFQATNRAGSALVAIVNEALASRYWPNQDAIGKRLRLGADGPWAEVIGVARTAKYLFMAENPTPFLYLPLAQNPAQRMTLLVHTAPDATAMAAPLRDVVRSIDRHQPVFDVRTMDEFYKERGLRIFRMIVEVVGSSGLLGLSLALIGIYGLVAYSVSRRTREIGVRMALGANSHDILRMVLRQGTTLALIGIGTGILGSVALVKAICALFSRTDTNVFEPWGFIAVPLVLLAATMLACYIPARTAARIDPNQALHYE